jgi:hypothetical protein
LVPEGGRTGGRQSSPSQTHETRVRVGEEVIRGLGDEGESLRLDGVSSHAGGILGESTVGSTRPVGDLERRVQPEIDEEQIVSAFYPSIADFRTRLTCSRCCSPPR